MEDPISSGEWSGEHLPNTIFSTDTFSLFGTERIPKIESNREKSTIQTTNESPVSKFPNRVTRKHSHSSTDDFSQTKEPKRQFSLTDTNFSMPNIDVLRQKQKDAPPNFHKNLLSKTITSAPNPGTDVNIIKNNNEPLEIGISRRTEISEISKQTATSSIHSSTTSTSHTTITQLVNNKEETSSSFSYQSRNILITDEPNTKPSETQKEPSEIHSNFVDNNNNNAPEKGHPNATSTAPPTVAHTPKSVGYVTDDNAAKRRKLSIPRKLNLQIETAKMCAISAQGAKSIEDRVKVMESLEMVSPELSHVSLYGIFDGHGGFGAAEFVQQNLWWEIAVHPAFKAGKYKESIKDAFETTDAKFLAQTKNTFDTSGTCALVLLLIKDMKLQKLKQLIVANLGDSRALLCRKNKKPLQLSNDHKVSSPEEHKRLLDAGALITSNKLFGMLLVSRALGDRDFKSPNTLLCEPEILFHDIEEDDEFVVIATDGIWDVLSNEEVDKIVRESVEKRQINGSISLNLQSCAEALYEEAVLRGSRDDISVVVRMLN